MADSNAHGNKPYLSVLLRQYATYHRWKEGFRFEGVEGINEKYRQAQRKRCESAFTGDAAPDRFTDTFNGNIQRISASLATGHP